MYCPICKKEAVLRYGYCTGCGTAEQELASGAGAGRGRTFDEGERVRRRVGTGTAYDENVQRGGSAEPREGRGTVFDPGAQGPPEIGGSPDLPRRTVFDPGVQVGPRGAGPDGEGPARKLVGWLVTFSHLPSGQDYRLLEGRNIIGSDPEGSSIVVAEDPYVSGRHAVIVCRDGKCLIKDSDSANGTFVNGANIFGEAAVALERRDQIRCGATEFIVCTIG